MASIEVSYFNTFLLKKIVNSTDQIVAPKWAEDHESTENNYTLDGDGTKDWFIEEARIRGGYNNAITDLGVRAYLIEEDASAKKLKSDFIWSFGVYNSKTGYNGTNNFSVAENISKSVDPSYGAINLLYAEDTNLTIGQTNKISRALIDKDAIYTGDGNAQITATGRVVGQITPYAGEYGIKDRRSFAVKGYRKYFSDPNRNTVLRMSADGFTEISNNGMKDFFRDNLRQGDVAGQEIVSIGYYDIHMDQYFITMFDKSGVIKGFETTAFSENVKGWVSRYTFAPEYAKSILNRVFAVAKDPDNKLKIWEMNRGRENEFFGYSYIPPRVDFIFNQNPSIVKSFKTIEYEGTDSWECTAFETDSEGIERKIFNIYDGKYQLPGQLSYSYAGFIPKENKYYATLNSSIKSESLAGRVLINSSGTQRSGVKGFYAVARFTGSPDNINHQELFTVGVNVTQSS